MSSPLRAPSRFDRLSILILFVVGVMLAIVPDWLGFGYFRERGSETRIVLVLVGFLFLFQAVSIIEKNRMRRRIDETFEAMNMLLYGKNFRRDREAIRILIHALRGKDGDVRKKAWENLKRLTGQKFALDHEVWAAWWQASEKRFAVASKRPEEEEAE
jgi:hypothetical protein